jgi:hypothetical protein
MARRGLSTSGFVYIVFISFLLLAPEALLGQQNPAPHNSSQQENSQPAQDTKPTEPEQTPGAGQEPSKESDKSQAPPQQESSNPAQAAAERTKEVTIKAAETTKQLAEQSLVHMRSWEQSWITGIFIERDTPLVPLTSKQRQEIYLRQTLATPGAYLKRMFAAGIDQARGAPSQWDDGFTGYMERFASREGQFISANTLAFLANSKLGYEVRYDQCRCKGFLPRARHAILRNLVTYDQREQNWRPQLGLYAGAFGGGLISTAWKPHPRNAFAEGGRAMAGQLAYGTLLNLFIEFATDINRKLGAKE